MQRRIALIDPEIWESGDPEKVAAEIAEIETLFAVANALGDLAKDRKTVLQDRHGIGGNNPPEEIDAGHPLAGSVTMIWAAFEDIRDEAEKDVPDKPKVRAALAALKAGLTAIVKWCGKKADLAVDTAIKWGVPAVGGGFFALNADKVGALIKAVQAWLPHIP
ncbi:hypothetical protein [Primorskyibacter sp. 2E233]|uniref:hypothetical protein n=1 Tax=Primorskyibacter sp. 2E233 TaxID=3413431 RepID=UPI003BEF887E